MITEPRSVVTVTVRRLRQPTLWYWEVYDERSNRVLSNSWIDDANGYASQGEALAAGLQRASAWSRRPTVRLNGISLPALR